ncbi:MAG: hypothetical protein H6739_07055 [Alphaproteobacteria bacterium]|nr:hypothetical protein [Alphaproteobacteria bacterium]
MILGLLGLALSDCGGPSVNVRRDTGFGFDTGGRVTARDSADLCFDCALEIVAPSWNCDSTGYWYDVYATGWQYGAELYIYQTGSSSPWFEFGHEFPQTEPWSTASDVDQASGDTRGYYSDYGYWDNPYMELVTVDAPPDVVMGSTTLFNCDDAETLTWSVVVYGENGASPDCASWGDDPTAEVEGYDFGRCTLF